MDIAAMSIDMHTSALMQNVELSMMKKTMDTEEMVADMFRQMLPPAPTSPYTFDVRA